MGESAAPTVLHLGLEKHSGELLEALLSSGAFDPTDPHDAWLHARYREIAPTVLRDALRCIETGDKPSPATLAAVRDSASSLRADPVPLTLVLRGAMPALRVFGAFLQARQPTVSPRELTVLMGRAALLASELGACWVERWTLERSGGAHVEVSGDRLQAVEVDGAEGATLEMLALAASGASNEAIASATAYSPQAVKWHLSRLMRAWNVGNRAALVTVAFLKGALVGRTGRRP